MGKRKNFKKVCFCEEDFDDWGFEGMDMLKKELKTKNIKLKRIEMICQKCGTTMTIFL